MLYHIEAETKWPQFSRWHFQMHFLEWKCINFDRCFTEVCSQGSNIPAMVQMAWRRPGDKPLSGPMMVNLLTHICVTRPQWINAPQASLLPTLSTILTHHLQRRVSFIDFHFLLWSCLWLIRSIEERNVYLLVYDKKASQIYFSRALFNGMSCSWNCMEALH